MKTIRFEISIEDKPEIKRVIEANDEHTFEDLHHAILRSVDFDNSQLASFFICNENWDKKLEITLIDMASDDSDFIPVMQDTEIGDYITAKGQKMIYEYDFVLMWRFLIEVTEVKNKPLSGNAPLLVASEGEAPAQYDTTEKYPTEITDEDTEFIKELKMKNHEAFGGEDDIDDDLGFSEGYDDDDLEGFGTGRGSDDDDY